MTIYNEVIKNLATFVRDELRQLDNGPNNLTFNIEISGRVNDGDLLIKYSIGSTYNTGGEVSGGDVSRVVDEYKHRFGWDKRNAPLCIGFDGEEQ